MRDAARVNSTRWHVVRMVQNLSEQVALSTGATTKFHRITMELPKTHYYDAVCIKEPPVLDFRIEYVLEFHAKGRGSRQSMNVDRFGFPKGQPKPKSKSVYGFQTGDLVKSTVTTGKKIGTYVGRVQVRSSGYFNIRDFRLEKRVQGISFHTCQLLQRNDGYEYNKRKREKVG